MSPTGRILDEAWLDRFEAKYGPVSRALSWLVRPTIVADDGYTYCWSDWSAIEARVLPWLSGSRGGERVLDIFRSNDKDPKAPDIYRIEAGNIFSKPPEEVDKGNERQTGKVAVLSLGFGGAEGALAAMATNYGIYLELAQQTHIVRTWRENNPWARQFWGAHGRDGSYGLWGAINRAIESPDTIQEAGRVAYVYDRGYMGGTVFCALPNGELLTYPKIKWEWREVTDKKTGETTDRYQLTYHKGYSRSALWYGKLAENITQATAAMILRRTLRILERGLPRSDWDWMPVVAHTHDEIVTQVEVARAEEAKERLVSLMETNGGWDVGLPLKAEATISPYYTKAVK